MTEISVIDFIKYFEIIYNFNLEIRFWKSGTVHFDIRKFEQSRSQKNPIITKNFVAIIFCVFNSGSKLQINDVIDSRPQKGVITFIHPWPFFFI